MTTHTTTQPALLPGQTNAADGPHDLTGMYLMHHAFRRDLARFEAAVGATPLADTATWARLSARWQKLATVLRHHHQVEDQAFWPPLLSGVSNPSELAVLDAMADEHHELDPGLAACARGFEQLARHGSGDDLLALQRDLGALRSTLTEHLRHEETEALPLVQAVMTDAQYAAAEEAAATGYPIGLTPFLLPWVAEGVPDDVLRPFLARAGRSTLILLASLRGHHARRERRAFRYVPS